MFDLNNIVSKAREQVNTSNPNLLVRVVGYSEDRNRMTVNVINPNVEGATGKVEVPEYLSVALRDNDGISRTTIAERSNSKKNSYLKADQRTGGLCFISDVDISEHVVQAVVVEDDNTLQVDAHEATCHWIDGVSASMGKDSPYADVKLLTNVAYRECFMEARNVEGELKQPFGYKQFFMLNSSVGVRTKNDLTTTILEKLGNNNLPKLSAVVAVRISAGDQSHHFMFNSARTKIDEKNWETLKGDKLLSELSSGNNVSRTRQWKAMQVVLDNVSSEQGDIVEAVTVEVIPGYTEYMSKRQLDDMNIFNENGAFVNDGLRQRFTNHWSLNFNRTNTDGAVYTSQTSAYFESNVVLVLNTDGSTGDQYWITRQSQPLFARSTSFLGSLRFAPTEHAELDKPRRDSIKEHFDIINARRKTEREANQQKTGAQGLNQSAQQLPQNSTQGHQAKQNVVNHPAQQQHGPDHYEPPMVNEPSLDEEGIFPDVTEEKFGTL
ncbi:hypothetical protein [Idiomarina abyssalis]|uniref:Uncharacterized protein n=1 Tax=Idiomarina abyssalis TaxID=86102 RepID=A0A8I1G9H7_9GAMM|nr:hypothetical protein [Idiomarina abyssalis]MBJ7265550.1 hypothetical protein [Idiomarina abyssalis]MBJ7316776.1 hypothetical protein [Idiomarina abyssalis]